MYFINWDQISIAHNNTTSKHKALRQPEWHFDILFLAHIRPEYLNNNFLITPSPLLGSYFLKTAVELKWRDKKRQTRFKKQTSNVSPILGEQCYRVLRSSQDFAIWWSLFSSHLLDQAWAKAAGPEYLSLQLDPWFSDWETATHILDNSKIWSQMVAQDPVHWWGHVKGLLASSFSCSCVWQSSVCYTWPPR